MGVDEPRDPDRHGRAVDDRRAAAHPQRRVPDQDHHDGRGDRCDGAVPLGAGALRCDMGRERARAPEGGRLRGRDPASLGRRYGRGAGALDCRTARLLIFTYWLNWLNSEACVPTIVDLLKAIEKGPVGHWVAESTWA